MSEYDWREMVNDHAMPLGFPLGGESLDDGIVCENHPGVGHTAECRSHVNRSSDQCSCGGRVMNQGGWAVLKRGKVITVIRGEGAENLARAAGDGVPGYSVEWRPVITDEQEGLAVTSPRGTFVRKET